MNKSGHVIGYGFALGTLCFTISLLIALLLESVGLMGGLEDEPESVGVADFISMIVVAPVFETGIMFFAKYVLGFFLSGRILWGLIGVAMAGLHAAVYLPWGIIVLIPFLIYSRIMVSGELVGRDKFLKVCTAHTTNNLIVFLLLFYL